MTGAISQGKVLKINKKTLKAGVILLLVVTLAVASMLLIRHLSGIGSSEVDYNKYREEMLEQLLDNKGEYDEQSIILEQTTEPFARALAERLGAELRITSNGNFAALTLPEGVTIEDVCRNDDFLTDLPRMSIDYKATISELDGTADGERRPTAPVYTVTDGSYMLQSYLNYINLQNIWAYTQGEYITVAVIDTGIDTDHPEFEGRISEYSYNATEDKIVKDYVLGNGEYDWSLIEDEQGHGTSVAGVIAASMNSGEIVGIAPRVELLVIKAECNEKGEFKNSSDLVFGLYYAIERDASVVNMSFGNYLVNYYENAAQLACDSDIICVAAAGNDTSPMPMYPAADVNVIGVGALADGSWELAEYSNYGESVNIVAPGTTYTSVMGGGYDVKNGTSLASPVVAGTVALYVAQNRFVELSNVCDALYASAYDLGDLGADWYFGYGALDANAFIMEERGTVSFNMMCDELEDIESVFIRNHTLQNIPEPERLYAVFDGWYYDPQFTEEYNWYEDVFTGDLTLYAKWVNEEDGIPFTYVTLDDGTIEIRSYTGHRRYVTIPDYIEGKQVSSIGHGAFAGESRIRQVTLPKYLKKIGASAFEGCNNLISIEIPDGVVSIGGYAFSDNVRLSSVVITSQSELESIGGMAFKNCAKLRDFVIPTKLTSVDGSAFYGATSIMSFNVTYGNTSFAVSDGVLLNAELDTLVAYPAGKKGEYELAGSVRKIGSYAFAFAHITEIDLDGVVEIGEYAFVNTWLESLVIPDSVYAVDKGAFSGTTYLTNVVIGNGLALIDEDTFAYSGLLSVNIPSGIAQIKDGAFFSSELRDLSFASDSQLETIGRSAFYSTRLLEVTFPSSLECIGFEAFKGCVSLKKVGFERSSKINKIDTGAFEGCFSLSEVELPEGLETIGELAFKETAVEEITLPTSLKSLQGGAFASCGSLESIWVADGSAYYTDINGVVYNKSMTELVAYPAGNKRTSYTVTGGVKVIGSRAFYGSQNIKTVKLPSSLEDISQEAFYLNTRLESMEIPERVITIGRYAFGYDYALTSIRFVGESRLSRISYASFANCGITEFRVPASVSTIAQEAFMGCDALTSFTFAKNSKLESISAYMFKGCENLTSITFEKGSALTSIQAHGFEGMRKLKSIDFGDAKLTNIDNFAFRFCESLERFEIPEGVTYVGRYAFYYCTELSELIVPESVEYIGRFVCLGANKANIYFKSEILPANLQEDWDYGLGGYYVGVVDVMSEGDWKYALLSDGGIGIIKYTGNETVVDMTDLDLGGEIVNIGGGAFADTSIEEVMLPETVNNIQAEAFLGSMIKRITIPSGVTFIGRKAFAESALESIVFAEGSKLQTIEQSAFEGTKALKTITLPASLTTLGRSVFNESGLESVVFEQGIKLTEIPESAFSYTSLRSLTLPDGIALIDHNAFRNTALLEWVSFGEGEMMIMDHAFYQSGLKSLTIPEGVTYIGEYAFVALPNLKEFKVADGNQYYSAVDGLLLDDSERKLIAVPAGREGELTVPVSVEVIGFGAFESSALSVISFDKNANILSFGYRAFYNAQNIKHITVPASVVAIDYYAFAMCRGLESITFEEGSRLAGVYEGAFYGCDKLCDIILPDSIVEISDFAFYGCRSLDRIPVSEGSELKGIFDYAMAYTGLKGELVTPKGLTDIGSYAFSGTKITSLTIPSDNSWDLVIGLGAFQDCNMLKDVTLPFVGASFEDLNITWFSYIFGAGSPGANDAYIPDSLESVKISEGITLLATGSFTGIENLVYVDLPYSVNTLYPQAFRSYGNDGIRGIAFSLKSEIYFVDMNGKQVSTVTQYYLAHTNIVGRLDIAEGVEIIEHAAFYTCQGISAVTIPEGVTYIGEFAFDGISATKIELPSTLEYIGEYCFQANRLEEIINHSDIELELGSLDNGQIAINAKKLVHKDGSVEYKDGYDDSVFIETTDQFKFIRENGEYYLVSYVGEESTVTLPTNIFGHKYIIKWSGGAENIIIPGELEVVNDRAFSFGGHTLRSVILEEGITRIEYDAFEGCVNLSSVTLPSSLEYISSMAFWYCKSLESIDIPEGVKIIEDQAFLDCLKLERINIPSSVTHIGTGAFAGCEKLSLSISPNNKSFTVIDGVVYDKDVSRIVYVPVNTTDIEIPNTVEDISMAFQMTNLERVSFEEGSRLTSVGPQAFARCKNLVEVDLPETITRIESGAFRECDALIRVSLPDSLTHISDVAFAHCYSLGEIDIPAGVSYIGSDAFAYCAALTEIVLPEGIEAIERTTFFECTGLTRVNIPDSVKRIEPLAFASCPITELVMSEDHPYFTYIDGAVYNKDVTEAVFATANVTSLVIPATVTKLNQAFSYSYALEISFEEGSQITRFEQFDFCDCNLLNKFTIPESVTVIEDWTFNQLEKLKYVVNNSDIELEFGSEDDGMIAKCAKLIVEKDGSIRRAPDDEYEGSYADFDYVDTPDGFRYIYHKGEYTMIAYLGGEDTVTLPEKVNGKSYNIRQLCGVKKVVLPEGVEAIYNQAFAYNPLLETVILPDSLRVIWSDAFAGSGLMYLDIPEGVEQIGNYAFAACFRLKSIELPEGIKIVGAWAFSNCISLESVVMPDSIVEIGESCFRHSKFYHDRSNWTDGSLYVGSNLIEADTNAIVFKVPENVTCIAYGAFDECYRLREIEIGNAPEGILMNMTNLETLVIYKMPEGGVREYFTRYGIMNVPITLKDVVLSEGVRMVEDAFSYIQNVNIFVDQLEKDTMWDENFPGWNNHNRVSYSDKWMVAKFYDGNGELIHKEVFLTSQVVRQPWVSDRVDGNLTYVFVGYDLDGDGVADFIPATSTSDILATAVFQSYDTCELNGHTEGDWIIEIEANCVQTGVQKKYCTVCLEEIDSREYTEIKHRESDWMNDGDYLYIECLDCHERFEEIYIGNGGGDSGNEGGGDSGNEGGGNSGNEGGGNKPSVSKPIQSESKPESKPEPQPEPNEDPVDGGNNDTNDGDSTLIIIIVSALAVALATAVVVIIVIKKKK